MSGAYFCIVLGLLIVLNLTILRSSRRTCRMLEKQLQKLEEDGMSEKKPMLRDLRGIASAFRPGVPSEDIVAEGRAKENTMTEKKPTVGEIIDHLEMLLAEDPGMPMALGAADARTLIDGVREMEKEIARLKLEVEDLRDAFPDDGVLDA